MMPGLDTTTWELEAFEGLPRTIVGRVKYNGANITQSSISAITAEIRKHNRLTSITPDSSPASLTVADVVYDTLQTDAKWIKDGTGYNFEYTVPASAFSSASTYSPVVVVFIFTPADNAANKFAVKAKFDVRPLSGATV